MYLSQRDAVNALFLYDFVKHAETQLTSDAASDQMPRFSPDGKTIAFVRDRKELRAMDVESKQERVLASGFLASYTWSPDSKWIAYAASGTTGLRNLFVVAAAGGSAGRQISFLANTM